MLRHAFFECINQNNLGCSVATGQLWRCDRSSDICWFNMLPHDLKYVKVKNVIHKMYMFIHVHYTSIPLKYNQDAKITWSIYFYNLLYNFQPVSPPIIRSTKLYIQRQVLSNHLIHDSSRQQYWLDNTWRCMYSFVLLMMSGETVWNMQSNL
jgi:hypothetical protein